MEDKNYSVNSDVNVNNATWYTADERSMFASIDHDQENKSVIKFQKTNDPKIFEEIYKARIPTLQIWARNYGYLVDGQDDMFGELCYCFTKAVFAYNKKRSSFNTCLYTFLINYIRNIQTGRRAKKRLPEGADPNSMSKFMLSLDYSYGGKDGSENCLRDVIADKMPVDGNAIDNIMINETINIISNGNPVIKSFLIDIGKGNTIASSLKGFKIRKGKINISKLQAKNLNGNRKQKRIVYGLIKEKKLIRDNFSVLNYSIKSPDRLYYTIEMKKTQETDFIMKIIRQLRKDKDGVLAKIMR